MLPLNRINGCVWFHREIIPEHNNPTSVSSDRGWSSNSLSPSSLCLYILPLLECTICFIAPICFPRVRRRIRSDNQYVPWWRIKAILITLMVCSTSILLHFSCHILFENKYKNDNGSDFILSVHGTDFRISQHGRLYFTPKFTASGLRYEIVILIQTGENCLTHDPFKCEQ